MENFIFDFISRFIPEKNKNDDKIFYQSLLLISAHFSSIVFLIAFILIHFLIQNYLEVYSLIFTLLVFIISLSLYPKRGNNIIFGNLVIASGFLSFLLISITDGGIFAPVNPWFTAVSLTGFLFANRKSGFFWSILAILTLVSLFILNLVGINFPAHFPEKYSVFDTFASFIGSSIYLILIILSYEFLSSKKNLKLKNLLLQNREKQEELSQQQEEILAQRDMLLDSEQRIRNILESLPDAVFMIDEHGNVSFWNDVIAEMTGIKSENIMGKGNYEYAKPFYNEARPILIDLTQINDDYLKENYTGISKNKNILQAETYVPSLRGQERYLTGSATPLFDSKGNYTGAVEIIHDITERKKSLEKIEKQKKNIEASIKYAKHIQQAVFPSTEILKTYFNDYFIYFKPRDIVSGDFYWMAEIKNQLIIVAADCTGHGVPGAFMSLLGISYLNEIVFEHNISSPENILNSLRAKIIYSLHQDKNTAKDGMDMVICKIDKKNKKIEYSGAHNPLLIIRNNEIVEYKANRMPVGFYPKIEVPNFVKHEISYHENDKFYLFSDGFKDQLSSNNGKINSKRFKELLLNISSLDFRKQKIEINNFFTEWKDNDPQTDDVLIIGFNIK